jgi:hypothetical protein
VFVECIGGLFKDEVGHRDVDLAGQLNETSAEVVLLRLPGQIE